MLPTALARRCWLKVRDRLSIHPAVRAVAAQLHLARAEWLAANHRPAAALAAWCGAARACANPDLLQNIEEKVTRFFAARRPEQWWELAPPEVAKVVLRKAAILKTWQSPQERGVLFLSFESQWQALLTLGAERLRRLAQEYQLVVAPTWSPPHHPVTYLLPRLWAQPIATTISHEADRAILPRIHPNYRPLPLFASSWVRADLYRPKPARERDIDLVMVANFGRYKRHAALFQALADPRAASLQKVVLVGQPNEGRTAAQIEREASLFGVRQRLVVRSQVTDAELSEILCRAKASVITSWREGSCVAVVESMMAGTPVALLAGASLGSGKFINPSTGRWLNPRKFGEELVQFVAEAEQFQPREWLLENGIECGTSSRLLNNTLRAGAAGPWTQDLWEHHWRPDPLLVDETSVPQALAEARRLAERFGLRLVCPQLLPAV